MCSCWEQPDGVTATPFTHRDSALTDPTPLSPPTRPPTCRPVARSIRSALVPFRRTSKTM